MPLSAPARADISSAPPSERTPRAASDFPDSGRVARAAENGKSACPIGGCCGGAVLLLPPPLLRLALATAWALGARRQWEREGDWA